MQYILRFAQAMLPWMLTALPVIILWRVIAVHTARKRGQRTTAWHEAGVLVFSLFLVGLLSQAVVPRLVRTMEGFRIAESLFQNTWEYINLRPGKVFVDTYHAVVVEKESSALLINFLGNIVMFMPLGFCPPLLWRGWNSVGKALCLGAGVSLLIEISQLPFTRITDIDDLWLNTLGCLLGYLLWQAIHKRTGWAGWKMQYMIEKR